MPASVTCAKARKRLSRGDGSHPVRRAGGSIATSAARAVRGRAKIASCTALVVLCVAAPPRPARAGESDPWFGEDKALHFAVSAAIAGTGYGVTTAFAYDRWKAFAVGGGAALAAGALKEGYDASGRGDPSWKDLGWDVIGAVVGLAVAWGIDGAMHGGKAPPLSSRVSLDPRVPSMSLGVRF